MIAVTAVPPKYVEEVWPLVQGYLSKAVRFQKDTFNIEAVKEMLDREQIILWVMLDENTGNPVAAATTRVVEYPVCRSMAIDWIGGKRMKEWLPKFSETLDKYAKDNGCKYIEGWGRPGWIKALKPFGYRQWSPTYRKEL